MIRTDHQSLKYLLEQRISTPAQQKWLTKLMGYVVYKKGDDNSVADALSRVPMEIHQPTCQLQTISVIQDSFTSRIKAAYQGDTTCNLTFRLVLLILLLLIPISGLENYC